MNHPNAVTEMRMESEKHMRDDTALAVQLRGVTKTYGALRAVEGLDLEIGRGETVAFLGPNGAGKTTTIEMLLGLRVPTSGSVAVFGMPPTEAIRQSRIGAMLQEGKLMPGVRVGEFLEFVRGQHPNPLPTTQLLELAGLEGLTQRRVDRLSGGQTQRVRLAIAIAGNPDLLVLDEPTAAMDVEVRREFWVRMRAYAALGHTLLFATHYLEEAETSASRLVIIAHGQLLADGPVADIQARYGDPCVSFTRLGGTDIAFERLPGVQHCETFGDRVTLHTRDADATVRALAGGAIPWKDLEVKTSTLEDTFITLVHNGKGVA
ncbi:MAG: Efflux ABC transporter, ATP-binding protein [Ktedonobacterales bacterium]|jgi:ABC-2 type transport system ATP-binding protein|nr:MAG: Efflux ABC transporter, ATP-binding protein [Ktedonobacterales bacterium]